MTTTKLLTDHDEIREWAGAIMGSPAIIDTSPAPGVQPYLRIIFDQIAYEDEDQPDRPPNAGGWELVEWDDWFKIFDANEFALEVSKTKPGQLDSWYEIVKRRRT